ncbi:MAG: hypothetical protein Q4B84_01075 [Clostridia bacterium]|nr:hypothetical protein [Clostridia bacterium]
MKKPSKKIVSAILSSTLILPTLSPCASAMGREKKPTPPNNESNAINSKKLIKSKITAEKSTTIENTTNEDTTENEFNQSSDTPQRIHENENETVFQSEVSPVEEPIILEPLENNTYIRYKHGNITVFWRRGDPVGRKCVFRKNSQKDLQEDTIYDNVNIKIQQNAGNFDQLNNVINTYGLSVFAKSILNMFLHEEGNLEVLLRDFYIFSDMVIPTYHGSTDNEYNYIKYQVDYFALNHTFNQNMTYQNFLQNEQQY